MFHHLLGKEFINLTEVLPVKISLPVPGRARNTLSVKDERKILLHAGKQAGHSIPENSLQAPGRRFCVLECFTTHIS